jgi:CRP-like cAMP-binding protein
MDIAELISRFLPLNEVDKQLVNKHIPLKSFVKGDLVLKPTDPVNASFFVLQGCVRRFYLHKGVEHTTHFYTEEQAIGLPAQSLTSSPFYLECLEPSTLAILRHESEKILYAQLPALESICRVTAEEDLLAQQTNHASLLSSSAEERYLSLQRERPELIQRVAQRHIASYLGIQPESLSRIRKRMTQSK